MSNLQRKGLVPALAEPATRNMIILTPSQMARLEVLFPIDTRVTDPIQAAVQLGQQSVLAAIRKGFASA